MKTKRLVAAILGVVIFGLGAWSPSPTTEPAPWDSTASAHHTKNAKRSRVGGFLLKGGLGVNGCSDRMCHDMFPLLHLRFGAYYRIIKYFGLGIHMAFLFNHPDDENRADAVFMPDDAHFDTFWKLVIGPEFRGIFPPGQWDFWLSLVLGYAKWGGDGEVPHPSGPGIADYNAWMHGFVLGWGVGFDYFIHKNMAVGADFYLYQSWFNDYCDEILGTTDCRDLSDWDRYDIGLWWSIGFVFTAWFGV
jgi:hypothetical protein